MICCLGADADLDPTYSPEPGSLCSLVKVFTPTRLPPGPSLYGMHEGPAQGGTDTVHSW